MRLICENWLEHSKDMFSWFVNYEKAFNQVPVQWFKLVETLRGGLQGLQNDMGAVC